LRKRIAAGYAILLLVVMLAAVIVMRARRRAAHPIALSRTVTIDAGRFEPVVTVAGVGDVITWINRDIVPHTATSGVNGFDSGTIETGKSWKYTATRTGDFRYICAFHPTTMKAVLRVK
jgi:plastocyanin